MKCQREKRVGVAAVEMALVLPILFMLFFMTVDFARVFWYTTVATYMARDGALFAASNDNTTTPTYSDTAGVQAAAAKDDSFASSNPFTVNAPVVTGTANASDWAVTVTVTYTFTTIMNYPGLPTSVNISRSCKMRIAQNLPD